MQATLMNHGRIQSSSRQFVAATRATKSHADKMITNYFVSQWRRIASMLLLALIAQCAFWTNDAHAQFTFTTGAVTSQTLSNAGSWVGGVAPPTQESGAFAVGRSARFCP